MPRVTRLSERGIGKVKGQAQILMGGSHMEREEVR